MKKQITLLALLGVTLCACNSTSLDMKKEFYKTFETKLKAMEKVVSDVNKPTNMPTRYNKTLNTDGNNKAAYSCVSFLNKILYNPGFVNSDSPISFLVDYQFSATEKQHYEITYRSIYYKRINKFTIDFYCYQTNYITNSDDETKEEVHVLEPYYEGFYVDYNAKENTVGDFETYIIFDSEKTSGLEEERIIAKSDGDLLYTYDKNDSDFNDINSRGEDQFANFKKELKNTINTKADFSKEYAEVRKE